MEHGAGDIESVKRDSQGMDRETRRMQLGESRLDNKHHGVAETLFFLRTQRGSRRRQYGQRWHPAPSSRGRDRSPPCGRWDSEGSGC